MCFKQEKKYKWINQKKKIERNEINESSEKIGVTESDEPSRGT